MYSRYVYNYSQLPKDSKSKKTRNQKKRKHPPTPSLSPLSSPLIPSSYLRFTNHSHLGASPRFNHTHSKTSNRQISNFSILSGTYFPQLGRMGVGGGGIEGTKNVAIGWDGVL